MAKPLDHRSFRAPALKLSEAPSQDIQLFRVGTFYHPEYGKFDITPEALKAMETNFKNKIRGIDIAIDYKHDSEDIAAGWIKELYLSSDGKELWAKVDWTPKGSQVLGEKEFRYISPDFTFNYQDNESLKKFGPVLLGAGLTNRPTIKNMEPVVQLSEFQYADALDACAKDWIPKLIQEGKDQDQAVAIAYSKCRSEMGIKSAEPTQREKLQQEQIARSKKYGIEVTQDSSFTPPIGQPTDESKYGDPVNYKFPMADASQAGNARVRFKQFATDIYKQDSSRSKVHERIVKRELELGVSPDFNPKDSLDAQLPEDLKSQIQKKKGIKAMDYKAGDLAALDPASLDKMSPEELKALAIQLLAKVKELQGANADAQKQMGDMQKQAKMAERKNQFAILLSEGKACKAQEESFLLGDMEKFISLAQPVKLNENGSSTQSVSNKFETKEQAEAEVIRLAEIKVKEEKARDLSQAISIVLRENQNLKTKIYG